MPMIGLAHDGDLEGAPRIAHPILLLAGVALVVRHLLLDVAARRERLVAGAGDDQAADRVVGFEHLHRIEQLGPELAVHGIEDVRPVERDDRRHRPRAPPGYARMSSTKSSSGRPRSLVKENRERVESERCVGCQLHLRIVIVEADPSVVAVVAARRPPSRPEMIAPSPRRLHCSEGSRMRPIPMAL